MIEILHGDEPYVIGNKIMKAKESVSELALSEFSELSAEVFLQAMQYPLFSKKQVIIVRLDKLGNCENLMEYIESPSSFTDLIIVVDEIDKRVKAYKELKSKKLITECNKLSQDKLQIFVLQRIKKESCCIKNDTYNYFVQRSGYLDDPDVNLYAIETYIRQLCMDADGGEITKKSVEIFVEKSSTEKTFALTQAMLNGEEERLYEMAVTFIQNGEKPVGMLSLLMRTFRLAYKGSLFSDKPDKELASLIGVPTYQLKSAMKYNSNTVHKALDILQKGVNDIKSGRTQGDIIFYKTIAEVVETLKGRGASHV